jgi:hypothetical protein
VPRHQLFLLIQRAYRGEVPLRLRAGDTACVSRARSAAHRRAPRRATLVGRWIPYALRLYGYQFAGLLSPGPASFC